MSDPRETLARISARADAATEGPWYFGDRWHIQGAGHCQCRESAGPLVREVRMNINGTMMQAHIHERPEPWHPHGINTAPSRSTGWHVCAVVNDTGEYGYMADDDAEFIAAARTDVPALVAFAEAVLALAAARDGGTDPVWSGSEVADDLYTLAHEHLGDD